MPDLKIKLVVVDASPLITLAAADALDYLLLFELPVILPDAVFHEATSSTGKLGASDILDWSRLHTDLVSVLPTQAFTDDLLLRDLAGRRPSRNIGERAAVEIVRSTDLIAPGEVAVLLSDDRDINRLMAGGAETTLVISTRTFLTTLEAAQRIQSADEVKQRALARGRNLPPRDPFADTLPEAKEILLKILGRKP